VTEQAGLRREDGRWLFGLDPAAYALGRPDYPAEIFEILSTRCGLGPGIATLEIGPGPGQATGELLARGASPLVAVEPDLQLAAYTSTRFGGAVDVRRTTFEEADLAPASFALATAATSWHWVDQEAGLAKVATVLAPGGWWAAWWSVYHDPDEPDELHRALAPLLEPIPSHVLPGRDGSTSGFILDRESRLADLNAAGAFEETRVDEIEWSLELDQERARALFATYSSILALPSEEQERVLSEIERIVAEGFGGRVERRSATILYTARRSAS
jgi:SAM-dependent methyltransferase